MNESFVARSKIKRLILKMRNEKNKANKQTNKKNTLDMHHLQELKMISETAEQQLRILQFNIIGRLCLCLICQRHLADDLLF